MLKNKSLEHMTPKDIYISLEIPLNKIYNSCYSYLISKDKKIFIV